MKKLLSLFAVLLILLSSLSGCAETPAASDGDPLLIPETEAPPEPEKSDLAVIFSPHPVHHIVVFPGVAYACPRYEYLPEDSPTEGYRWFSLDFETMAVTPTADVRAIEENPEDLLLSDGRHFYAFHFEQDGEDSSRIVSVFRCNFDGSGRVELALPEEIAYSYFTGKYVVNRDESALYFIAHNKLPGVSQATKTFLFKADFSNNTLETLLEIEHNNTVPFEYFSQDGYSLFGVDENNLILQKSRIKDDFPLSEFMVTDRYVDRTLWAYSIDDENPALIPYEKGWAGLSEVAVEKQFTDPYTDIVYLNHAGYVKSFDPVTGAEHRIDFDTESYEIPMSHYPDSMPHHPFPRAATEEDFIIEIGYLDAERYYLFPIFALISKEDFANGNFNVREFDYSALIGKD